MSIVLTPPSVRSLIKYSYGEFVGEPRFTRRTIRDENRMSERSKARIIMEPNGPARMIHANLREYIRTLPVNYDHATAYRPGCSVFENVSRHRDSRYFYLLDLESAYDQVIGSRLANILVHLVYKMAEQAMDAIGESWVAPTASTQQEEGDDLLGFLSALCLIPGGKGLLTGAPASQDLFNIYLATLVDGRLAQYCAQKGFVYSRYGDDLTISSRRRPIGKVCRRRIREILAKEDLPVSHHKCQVIDLPRLGGQTIKINGLNLHWGGQISAPKKFRRAAQTITQAALQSGNEDLFHRSQGLVSCVMHAAQGRALTESESKLDKQFYLLRAQRESA